MGEQCISSGTQYRQEGMQIIFFERGGGGGVRGDAGGLVSIGYSGTQQFSRAIWKDKMFNLNVSLPYKHCPSLNYNASLSQFVRFFQIFVSLFLHSTCIYCSCMHRVKGFDRLFS